MVISLGKPRSSKSTPLCLQARSIIGSLNWALFILRHLKNKRHLISQYWQYFLYISTFMLLHHSPSPESLSFAWLLWVPVTFIGLKKDWGKSHRKLLSGWTLQLAMFLCQSCHKENCSSNLFLHFLQSQTSFALKIIKILLKKTKQKPSLCQRRTQSVA